MATREPVIVRLITDDPAEQPQVYKQTEGSREITVSIRTSGTRRPADSFFVWIEPSLIEYARGYQGDQGVMGLKGDIGSPGTSGIKERTEGK